MLYSLLSTADTLKTVGKVVLWVAIVAVLFLVMFYLPSKREKARQEEETKKLSAIKVGSKIKTIGGIIGEIVEIDEAENTFVIATGTEEHKGYLKIDKRAIYDTDAVAPEAAPEQAAENAEVEGEPTEEPFEETTAAEAPVETEETPVEAEEAAEEAVEETPTETEEKEE